MKCSVSKPMVYICNKTGYLNNQTAEHWGFLFIPVRSGVFEEKYFHNLPMKFQADSNPRYLPPCDKDSNGLEQKLFKMKGLVI
jgi:hypothetical protein